MKILLVGKNGQIGYELERSLQGLGDLMAIDRAGMDLANLDQVREVIRAIKPDILINAAAYTAVDKAETDAERAMLVNGRAPGVMAEELNRLGGMMIHYSSDYVFDGTKAAAYVEGDPASPINIYGQSKLAGELAIQAAGVPHLIFRTSWIYGARGKNFLRTVLRAAKEQNELRIVDDQVGAPTWCRTVADATAHVLSQAVAQSNLRDWWCERSGTYHLTAQGEATWFEFANAILELKTPREFSRVIAIRTEDYPTPAARPANSRLSCARFLRTFCGLPDWKGALSLAMTDLRSSEAN